MLFSFLNEVVKQRGSDSILGGPNSSIVCPCPHGPPKEHELLKMVMKASSILRTKVRQFTFKMDEFIWFDQYEVLQFNCIEF